MLTLFFGNPYAKLQIHNRMCCSKNPFKINVTFTLCIFSAESGSSVDIPGEKHEAQNSIAELLKTVNQQSLPKQQM